MRQIGQLMDDDLRTSTNDRIAHGAGIENVNNNGIHAARCQFLNLVDRTRGPGHLVPARYKKRRQPPPDRSTRPGQKNAHDCRTSRRHKDC